MNKDERKQVEQQLIERFQKGDLSPIAEISRIQIPANAPCLGWSWNNMVLAFACCGQVDVRGFQQWQKVGRHVKKGVQADAFIFGHLSEYEDKKDLDKDGKPRRKQCWPQIPMFSIAQTEGEPIPEYEPRDLPPLMDVAKRLGITVMYGPTVGCNGNCNFEGDRINLGTFDPRTFWHELGHAADARTNGKLKGRQVADQEIRAELCACIIAAIYGMDYTGKAWEYIRAYCPDGQPMTAIAAALEHAGKLVDFIFEQEESNEQEAHANTQSQV